MPDWNLSIHWNPLCKWKRHFISRLSGGVVCMSTSPSADHRSDPSGETTINGVPYFFVIHLVDTFLTKISGLETKPASFCQPSSQLTLILFALPILHSLVWWCFRSVNLKCATQLVEKRVAHIISFLKNTSCIFLNIFLFNTPPNMSPSCTENNCDILNAI